MRIITTILLFICLKASATNYYVKNGGNDVLDGLTDATAWATIAKVNSASYSPGDSILFKAGNIWIEKLIPASSGSISLNIIYASYGVGANPLFTGLQDITLSNEGANIWSATASSSVKDLFTVLIGGEARTKARYPNTGYLLYNTSTSTKTQVVTSLTGTPDYSGGECVTRSSHFTLDVSKISSQSTGTLNIYPALTYTPNIGGNGYFLQNLESFLDLQNEWVYDSTTKKLTVYSVGEPTVKYSTLDTLVYLRKVNYITFNGLSFSGANRRAIRLDTCRGVVIQNCNFENNGFAISGTFAPRTIVQNDTIINSLSNAVLFISASDTSLVHNNYIRNTGILPGIGVSGSGTSLGIYFEGIKTNFTNNVITKSGYNAIYWAGRNCLIKNNFIDSFNLVKDDGGGIYSYIGTYFAYDYDNGSRVTKNIVLNGLPATAGTTSVYPSSNIYMDNNVRGVTVDSNFAMNGSYSTFFMNTGAQYLTVFGNTFVNNLGHAGYATGNGNLSIKNNIFYSADTTKALFVYAFKDTVEIMDSNFYSRPVKEAQTLSMHLGGGIFSYFNLSEWTARTTYDVNSTITPSGITTEPPLIIYNKNGIDSTVLFPGRRISMKGVEYNGSIILKPFTSAILFNSSTQSRYKFQLGGLKFQ